MKKLLSREWLEERTPPGIDLGTYLMRLKIMLTIAFLMAQWYWVPFFEYRKNLFRNGHLVHGVKMPSFLWLLTGDGSYLPILGFCVVMALMVYWMFAFYRFFFHGSMSIYTMRRLPDRRELPRRCLTLPLVGIACTLILMVLTIALFGVLYLVLVPSEAWGGW